MKKMNKKGFTLVEMLVVIAIIAILVSILIPTVLGATKKAKAATDAANLRSALAEFEIQLLSGNVDFDKATSTEKVSDFAPKASGSGDTATNVWYKVVTPSKSDKTLDMMYIYKDANKNIAIGYIKSADTKLYTIDYFSTVAEGGTATATTITTSVTKPTT